MKKIHLHSFALGIILTLLVGSLVMVGSAAQNKTISGLSGVSLFKDDQRVIPTDVNGNQVEVFVYNGTTYVPIRAVSNLFNTTVQWDGQTRSAYIGKHSSTSPAIYLEELHPFMGFDLKLNNSSIRMTDNEGKLRSHVISESLKLNNTYNLNGNYSRITGTFYVMDGWKSSSDISSLRIYGDGKLLYENSVTKGTFPIDFDVDLTGVLQMRIECDFAPGALSEVALWT